MIWKKPLAWFLMGSGGLPLAAPVTSECIPYRDVCYAFPNAGMDIPAPRTKRQDIEDIYALRNDSMRDDTYSNYLLQVIEEGKLQREREEQLFNMQNARRWKTRKITTGKRTKKITTGEKTTLPNIVEPSTSTTRKKTKPSTSIKSFTSSQLTPRPPAVENNDPAASTGEFSKPHRHRRSCLNTEFNLASNGKSNKSGNAGVPGNQTLSVIGNTSSSKGDDDGNKKTINTTRMSAFDFAIKLENETENMNSSERMKYYYQQWRKYAYSMEKKVDAMEKKMEKEVDAMGKKMELNTTLTAEKMKRKDLEYYRLVCGLKLRDWTEELERKAFPSWLLFSNLSRYQKWIIALKLPGKNLDKVREVLRKEDISHHNFASSIDDRYKKISNAFGHKLESSVVKPRDDAEIENVCNFWNVREPAEKAVFKTILISPFDGSDYATGSGPLQNRSIAYFRIDNIPNVNNLDIENRIESVKQAVDKQLPLFERAISPNRCNTTIFFILENPVEAHAKTKDVGNEKKRSVFMMFNCTSTKENPTIAGEIEALLRNEMQQHYNQKGVKKQNVGITFYNDDDNPMLSYRPITTTVNPE